MSPLLPPHGVEPHLGETQLPSGVEMLGSQSNGMALVLPSENDSEVVDILHKINRMLQERRVQSDLQDWIKQGNNTDNSARHIQGGRIEIFLAAQDKTSTFFDMVLATRLPPGSKHRILNYARQQALRDPRLTENANPTTGRDSNDARKSSNYVFGNFSIIVCLEACHAQSPHIDLTQPNYQFGLIVSDGAEGTLFFEPESHIQNVDALAEHWQAIDSAGEKMPKRLMEVMRKEESIAMLLDSFGDTLLPERYVLQNMKNRNNLPTGSLLSLPGGVLHAGPASSEFRAVLFFSGWPTGSDIAPYDPDIQYMGTLLVGHLTSLLWHKEEMGFPERHYLLQRLAEYTEHSTVRGLWGHFRSGELANFVGNIEEKGYQGVLSREAYIEKVAAEMTIRDGDPITEEVFYFSNFQQVSVDNLFTLWDGNVECRVLLYRRIADGKLVLRYPSESGEGDEYEGHREEENFRLTMKGPNKQALFDGTNGILLDTDGKEVKVFTK